MLKLDVAYAGAIDDATAAFPYGLFKNETTTGDYVLTIDFSAQTYSLSYSGSADGTPVDKDWANNIEGIHQAILDDAGLTPDGAIEQVGASQVLDAIKIIAQRYAVQTGTIQYFARSTAPTGYVKANGRTIGSAVSGATERANSDTQALYELLWAEFDNTILPIQDSSGSPATRGSTATSDFAANKRMPLHDLQGRFVRGWSDGSVVDSGRELGSFQTDAIQNITGNLGMLNGGIAIASGAFASNGSAITHVSAGVSGNDPSITFDASRVARTSTETRPSNMAFLTCIKL